MAAFRAAIEAAGLRPPADLKADGRLHRFSTSPRPADDAGWYVLHPDAPTAGAFGDWRTGLSQTWCAGRTKGLVGLGRVRQLNRSTATTDPGRRKAALALWGSAAPAEGTVVETYLAGRALRLLPPTLRFCVRLCHPTGSTWPVMLALVTHGRTDKPMAVHRTFLARDGSGKAPVRPNRMMLGPCAGGVVRLAPAQRLIMVGEGIETCLSAMQASGLPAWAALSTSGLRTLELPDAVREVIVLADGDDPGEAAAEMAAARWARESRRVRVARAPRGMDFNDLLLAPMRGAP
jgi:phage/plasmid primase-like uncharacterized protein